MTTQRENIEKIERYVRGEADESDKKYVVSLFLDGENNFCLKQSLEKDWDLFLKNDIQDETDMEHLLDRIHHIIHKNETLIMKKPLQKFIRIYSKIAAIIIIPILLAGGLVFSYLTSKYQNTISQNVSTEIYAPPGSRVSFSLPDGTVGMLNAGSHLSYSLPFSDKRNAKLNGEAWLEVKHDENHPFIISAGNSTVKVVGTSLNLSTYPDENYIEVVLKEGRVEFIGKAGDKEVTMLPSERLVFQKGEIQKSKVDPLKYNAWIEGKLIFRSDPMAEVARRIERWYNVKIILADKDLERYTFRATFQDDKLEDVLKFLAMTSPIRYRITPRALMQDGTYKKEEVTIYLK